MCVSPAVLTGLGCPVSRHPQGLVPVLERAQGPTAGPGSSEAWALSGGRDGEGTGDVKGVKGGSILEARKAWMAG